MGGGEKLNVNILGTNYEVRNITEKDYPKLSKMGANGLCELYSKEIIINSEMNPNSGEEFANFKDFENKVLRHEIVHAFFHESGLDDYTRDEDLVNWIAIQFPKMLKAFQDTNCL